MSTYQLSHTPLALLLQRQAANLLTAARILLLFVAAGFSVSHSPVLQWLALPISLATLLADWLDGVAARRWHADSKMGGVMDIAGDRIVENVWWITFAWLRLIPLWVPVVVITRGFLTDAIRSYALSRGETAFGREAMIRSRLGFALVASRASRAIYGGAKVLAFAGLFGLKAALPTQVLWGIGLPAVHTAVLTMTYLTVSLCVLRALPVFVESRRLFSSEERPDLSEAYDVT